MSEQLDSLRLKYEALKSGPCDQALIAFLGELLDSIPEDATDYVDEVADSLRNDLSGCSEENRIGNLEVQLNNLESRVDGLED